MNQCALINEWEDAEPTYLEKEWGERLTVPYYAIDDSDTHKYGSCLWTPSLPFHHLFWCPLYDVCVYDNCDSWVVKTVALAGEVLVADGPPVVVDGFAMVPLEGGGGSAPPIHAVGDPR